MRCNTVQLLTIKMMRAVDRKSQSVFPSVIHGLCRQPDPSPFVGR